MKMLARSMPTVRSAIIIILVLAHVQVLSQGKKEWWNAAGAMKIVSLKPENREIWAHYLSLDPAVLSEQLDTIKAEGYTGIQIWGPPHSGAAYGGLNTIDNYNIDPSAGTSDQLKELIQIAQKKDLVVTCFINLCYFAQDAPDWVKAQKDPGSVENGWFLWSESGKDPKAPYHEYLLPEAEEFQWIYSPIAKKYVLGIWNDHTDEDDESPNLPQAYWGGSSQWPEEVARIARANNLTPEEFQALPTDRRRQLVRESRASTR